MEGISPNEYVLGKIDPLYKDGGKVLAKYEDEFTSDFEVVSRKIFGRSPKELSGEELAIAGEKTSYYTALRLEGEMGYAEAALTSGDDIGFMDEVKDKQILQKYGINSFIENRKNWQALSDKLTKRSAENNLLQYAQNKTNYDTSTAAQLWTEVGMSGVGTANKYNAGNAGALGVGYSTAEDVQSAVQKTVQLSNQKRRIEQSLENIVV